MEKDDEKFLTIKEVAGLLGVTPLTLRNWDKKGKLVSFRNPVNGYRMYTISQIEEFFDEMRRERNRRGKFKIKIKVVEVKD